MELTYSEKTVVALGNFDGLHRGHMSVINMALNTASRLKAKPLALVFSEHPLAILDGETPKLLFTGQIRNEAFEKAGVEVFKLDFNSLKDMSPEEFFKKIILETTNAAAVCCGFNYSFGKNGVGKPELLRELCEANGVEFLMAEETDFEGEPISSTRIRKAIEDGDIEKANLMLGHPFTYRQLVVDGDKRGRLFGTPTINQYLSPELVEPKHGVYMSKTILSDDEGTTVCEYYSVTNVGTRPTVGAGPVSSETYILDFEGDLYGKYVTVSLLKFLRPEMKFDSLEALKDRILFDAETVRKYAKFEH